MTTTLMWPAARRLTIAVIGVTVLAGCIGTFGPRGTWIKAGAVPDEGERDAYECEREAVIHRSAEAPANVLYEQCMRARGYVRPGERAGAAPNTR